jgi:hypothetical protein
MFRFNKEIKVSYEAQKIGVERLSKCKGSILIQMIMDKTVAQEKTKSKGKSEQTEKNNGILTIDVAKGSFDFNDILMNKRFTLQTKLNLDSLITLDKKKNELKGKKDKKDSAANQDLLPKNVGWVHMDIRLGREDRGQDLTDEESDCEELAYDAWENEKVSKEKIANRGKAKGSKHDPAIIEVQNKKEFESRTSTESLLPVCLFLHVLRAVKTTSRPKSRISRNLYIKHKIYGTPDDITSQVFWNQSSPDIDHRAVVPMTNHTIKLMVSSVYRRKKLLLLFRFGTKWSQEQRQRTSW